MVNKKHLRIVVGSPNDIKEERGLLTDVVERINRNNASPLGLHLDLIKWETDGYPDFHSDGPQGILDPILDFPNCDIFIGIFWHSFGTVTKDGMTGTQHEFNRAFEEWKKKQTSHIMFYFNQKEYSPKSSEDALQWADVLKFKESMPKEGLYWNYSGKEEFAKIVYDHLANLLNQNYGKDQKSRNEDQRKNVIDSMLVILENMLKKVKPYKDGKPAENPELEKLGKNVIGKALAAIFEHLAKDRDDLKSIKIIHIDLLPNPIVEKLDSLEKQIDNQPIITQIMISSKKMTNAPEIYRIITELIEYLKKLSHIDNQNPQKLVEPNDPTNLKNSENMERKEISSDKQKPIQQSFNNVTKSQQLNLLACVDVENLRPKDALTRLNKAIELDPHNCDAYVNRASVFKELNRVQEAIDDLDVAIKEKPNDAQAYNNRGVIFVEINQRENAEKDLRQAIKLDPKMADAYNSLGSLLVYQSKFDQAHDCFDKAIEMNPKLFNVHVNRGYLYSQQNNDKKAIEEYEKTIQIKPNYAPAYNMKGVSLSNLERYEEAIESFDRALEINPNYPNALLNKGVALKALGRKEEANRYYEKAGKWIK